jgi:type II secretory pathway component PulJ
MFLFIKMFKKLKKDQEKGYTLIEVLVASTLFFVVIAGPTGLFISSMRSQARTLALRETVDNTSHVMEYMSRFLRMARKDIDGTCITSGKNYENLGGDLSKVRFLNYDGFCQEFSLTNDRLEVKKSIDGNSSNLGTGNYLTSDDLIISFLNFKLSGEGQEDDLQPRLTIVFEISKKGQPETSRTRIQTTISQRNLDVTY